MKSDEIANKTTQKEMIQNKGNKNKTTKKMRNAVVEQLRGQLAGRAQPGHRAVVHRTSCVHQGQGSESYRATKPRGQR